MSEDARAGCAAFEDDLSALVDGALPADRAAAVAAHAAECARCAARRDSLATARDAVAAALRAPGSGDEEARLARIEAGLRARLAAEPAPPVRRTPGRAAPRRMRGARTALRAALALAAAGALALLVFGRLRAPVPAVPEAPDRAPEVAREPAPAPDVPAPPVAPAPAPPGDADALLAAADEADLDVALALDTVEDLDVIEQLDLLERLQALEDGGSG